MNGARSYMQRGTRFCTRSRELWIEYAKLEMIYIAKIAARRRILGLDKGQPEESSMDVDETADGFTTSENLIAIPDFNSNSLQSSMIEGIKVDSEVTKDPMTTPALNGAIPLAIFDAARQQPFFCASAAEDFFDMFAAFTQVRCLPNILQHVLDAMVELYPVDPFTCSCYTKQPLVGLDPASPEFPIALSYALDRLKESMEKVKDKDKPTLVKKTKEWVGRILEVDELDSGIKMVLEHTLKRLK